jgi:hypothetical protein
MQQWGTSQTETLTVVIDRVYKQEIKMDSIIMWVGSGWYAPRQEGGAVWYYRCGDTSEQEPDTYPFGLGTPEWFDEPPVSMEVKRPLTTVRE